ncbi:MAG: hypothetical protein BRC44_15185 [Cyanobacteria bacterium QS_4_48_99]|nr:MAG: hypothetical protein BRC44_15185 [Cyanobacteria bacterium QS_4_48_99]
MTATTRQPTPQLNNIPILLDPTVLRAAQQIYRAYYEVYPERTHQAFGIVIDRHTHRGQPTFSDNPILLPQECFVFSSQLEAEK